MEITRAQKDVRETFLGGFAGQFVSAVLWAVSAAACTWRSLYLGEVILIVGGFFIFPLTQLMLRIMGQSYALPKHHPMNGLGIQIAFTLPLTLLLVVGVAVLRPAWFYPAMMIAVGAHYLPFVFLYGMRQFAVLCGMLVTVGLLVGMYLPKPVSLGAWFTSALLLVFAFVGRHIARSEKRASAERAEFSATAGSR